MRKTCWFALFLVLGLLVSLGAVPSKELSQPASAAGGPADIQSPILDPFINIWTSDGVENLAPAVAYNTRHDEYLVVWYNEQGPSVWDVYARRVRGDGTLLSWFTVVSAAGQKNWQPDVAYSPAQDEYLVVYTYEVTAGDYDVWARRVSWNGGSISPEFPINTGADMQWNPAVAYNGQRDEYLVVYENWWAGGTRDIDAQRVRASDGQLQTRCNIATGGVERISPDVAYNEARDEYLVVYTCGVGPNGNIVGKVASGNLGTLSAEIDICSDSYDQDFPSVAAGPDEYFIAWEDGVWGTDDYDIYGRRVDGDGVPQDPDGGFAIAGETANLHVDPAVAYGSGYGYLVAWRYFDAGASGEDVYGRYVMPGRNQPTGAAIAIDDGANLQGSPALACNRAGDCLVVERDDWPGVDYDIRGRFVRPHHVYLPVTFRTR